MRVILIFALILLTLTSCRNQQPKEQAVKDFTLQPLENYYQKTYDEPFFKEAHYDYAPDSTRKYYSAETIILSGTLKHLLRTCKALVVGDSLLLRLTDTPFSKNGYDLQMLYFFHGDGQMYYKLYFGGDTVHQVPIYTVVSASNLLDKASYHRGDSLKGKIALTALVYPNTKDKTQNDTISIYGLIKTRVE